MNRKPFGVVLTGVFAGLLGGVLLVVFVALSGESEPDMVAVRAGVAGLAAISLVAAEALARMRPWFYRASFWLVASICALIITFCVGYGGVVGVGAALMILFLLLAFLVPLLFYLRDEARSMGTLPARRAVPGRIP